MKLIRKLVAPTIWLIVISFLLWGVQSVLIGLRKETAGVGKAFGKIVTFKEFQDSMRSAELLSRKPNEKMSAEELESGAWQNIVLSIEAKREKISASDEDVLNEVKKFFGGEEMVDSAAYQNWVARNFGEQPRAFEGRIRNLIRVQKLVAKHRMVQTEVTDLEIKRFYFDQQNKLSVEYAKLNSPEEAKQFREKTDSIAKWDTEKKKEGSKITPLGPISVEIFSAILKTSESDTGQILQLEKDAISNPFKIKDGYGVFRMMSKEIPAEDKFDEPAKEQFKKRLIEHKKQAVFFDWWNEVMKRAAIEKFGKTVTENQESAAGS